MEPPGEAYISLTVLEREYRPIEERAKRKLPVILAKYSIQDLGTAMTTFVVVFQQEAARYLETYKAYEQKSAESIQEKVGHSAKGILRSFFTALYTFYVVGNVTDPKIVGAFD